MLLWLSSILHTRTSTAAYIYCCMYRLPNSSTKTAANIAFRSRHKLMSKNTDTARSLHRTSHVSPAAACQPFGEDTSRSCRTCYPLSAVLFFDYICLSRERDDRLMKTDMEAVQLRDQGNIACVVSPRQPPHSAEEHPQFCPPAKASHRQRAARSPDLPWIRGVMEPCLTLLPKQALSSAI